MPGILFHIAAAVISLLVVHFIHFKLEYSLAVFIGNFLPDALKFGISGIYQGTLSIYHIRQDYFYFYLDDLSGQITHWLSAGFFVFGLLLLLYHFHCVKKKSMEEYDELYVFLLIGIVTHLVMDALIIEQGIWF
ncbi:MAG TPA: hypothetical protein VJJ82_05680 [Candidatus Nanoarchaeia archaeon]|nr:hypothetical protein [Candidatus Nanoarchaeia archaeon]